jgi:hypothetical protein
MTGRWCAADRACAFAPGDVRVMPAFRDRYRTFAGATRPNTKDRHLRSHERGYHEAGAGGGETDDECRTNVA